MLSFLKFFSWYFCIFITRILLDYIYNCDLNKVKNEQLYDMSSFKLQNLFYYVVAMKDKNILNILLRHDNHTAW
jgi:hypothetical protein